MLISQPRLNLSGTSSRMTSRRSRHSSNAASRHLNDFRTSIAASPACDAPVKVHNTPLYKSA
jgi:hypothetical protein